MNWSPPIRIEPRGHRLFRDLDSNRWAIADNTGPTPELTEGGVLWIETNLPLLVLESPTTVVLVRVWTWSERMKRGYQVWISPYGALQLVQRLGMKIEFSLDLKPLAELAKLA